VNSRLVIIAPLAESDIEAIVDFIGQDYRARAASFARELRKLCLSLAESPERLPLAQRLRETGVRKIAHGSYLIFYRVYPDRVTVARILHGATDYEARLLEP